MRSAGAAMVAVSAGELPQAAHPAAASMATKAARRGAIARHAPPGIQKPTPSAELGEEVLERLQRVLRLLRRHFARLVEVAFELGHHRLELVPLVLRLHPREVHLQADLVAEVLELL